MKIGRGISLPYLAISSLSEMNQDLISYMQLLTDGTLAEGWEVIYGPETIIK